MRALERLVNRLRALFGPGRADASLANEIALHLEEATREHIARGLSRAEARLAARREFGSVALVEDQCRDTRRIGWIHGFVQDVRHGLRALLRPSAATELVRRGRGFDVLTIAPPPGPPRVAHGDCERPVVPRRHEVDRLALQRSLHHLPPFERPRQAAAREALQSRPEADVHGGRVLRLDAADAFEGGGDLRRAAIQQLLAGQQGTVQVPRREAHDRCSAARPMRRAMRRPS